MADRDPKNERDFLQMQQEAIRRVREMQARARRTLEDAGMPIEPPSPPQHPPEPARDARQSEPPAPEEKEPAGKETEEPPLETGFKEEKAASLPFHLSLDSEQIMLMLLIYLLYKDHGDQYLMMALAYLLLT